MLVLTSDMQGLAWVEPELVHEYVTVEYDFDVKNISMGEVRSVQRGGVQLLCPVHLFVGNLAIYVGRDDYC